MGRAKEKIDARKRKIDAMKVKLRRVNERIDEKEMYSKRLLSAISYVSNRLMYGKSVENQTKSDTQYTSKLGATTTGFKEDLHEFPQSNIIYGDGFSEPDGNTITTKKYVSVCFKNFSFVAIYFASPPSSCK